MTFSQPVALAAHHHLDDFDCGDVALNGWLGQRARKNESRFSRTYVVADGDDVRGYYCLAAGSIERQSTPGTLRRNAPDAVPVAVIGRLAVDKNFAGRGIGTDLLGDALKRCAAVSRTIAIAAVLVQAKNERAKQFYLSHARFVEYPDESKTLFLPINAILFHLSDKC